MAKIINYFLAKAKAKKQRQLKILLKIGLTWKTLNPKSLQELKAAN